MCLGDIVLWKGGQLYWHNPKIRTSERVRVPSDDEEAIHMLAGHPDSATFVSEYAELRRLGTPIELALVSVGHEERLRQHEYMPVRLAERESAIRRARPSAIGYKLLLAVRLREEGKDLKGPRLLMAPARRFVRFLEG